MLRAPLLALSFLTRVPVGDVRARTGDFGRSLVFFPVVGAALSTALWGVEALLHDQFAPPLRSLLLVGLVALLSGGLHLDGLADTFDALGGGQGKRERMLAILRDSRIGAHGATALVVVLLAKVLALGQLLESGSLAAACAFPAVGRWLVTPLVACFGYARDEGLGRSFHEEARAWHWLLATALLAGLAAALEMPALAWQSALAALAASALFAVWVSRRLGGLTGDVHGAAIELGELCFLLPCAAGAATPG